MFEQRRMHVKTATLSTSLPSLPQTPSRLLSHIIQSFSAAHSVLYYTAGPSNDALNRTRQSDLQMLMFWRLGGPWEPPQWWCQWGQAGSADVINTSAGAVHVTYSSRGDISSHLMHNTHFPQASVLASSMLTCRWCVDAAFLVFLLFVLLSFPPPLLLLSSSPLPSSFSSSRPSPPFLLLLISSPPSPPQPHLVFPLPSSPSSHPPSPFLLLLSSSSSPPLLLL